MGRAASCHPVPGVYKSMFIVKPPHITSHFLHLYTLKIGLKLHVCVLKILGLAMPMHMSIFHQDFPQLIFHHAPLKIAYARLPCDNVL